VQAELGKHPDVVQVQGDVTFCTRALKALKTPAYSKLIVVIPMRRRQLGGEHPGRLRGHEGGHLVHDRSVGR
jgi:hypothetical protein